MAIMSGNQRAGCRRDVMSDLSDAREPCGLSKSDLRAAIDAIDQWIHDNAAAFNAAIPQPARSTLTSAQKARLFAAVVRHRFLNGT